MENRSAEQILAEARERRVGSRSLGYTDDKRYVQLDDLITLIQAGGTIVPDTTGQGSGLFAHSVLYEGHQFVTATPHPAEYFEQYTPKK